MALVKDARAERNTVHRPDVQRSESDYRFWMFGIFLGAISPACISVYANFYGIDAYNAVIGDMSLSTAILAALVSVTVGVLVWIAWALAATFYPIAKTPWLRVRAMLQVFLTVTFVLLISTSLNLIALVGGPSSVLTMRENVRVLAEAADAPVSANTNADALLLQLDSQRAATCSCAEREGRVGSGGCITSDPGPGQVAANAAALCAMMTTGADAFREVAEAGATRTTDFRAILDRLNATLRDDTLSVAERREAYIEDTGRFRDALRDGMSTGVCERASAIASNVRASVAGVPVTRSDAFGQEQARALATLRAQAESFAGGLEASCSMPERDQGREVLPVIDIPEPPTPIEAIFLQVHNTFPMIAVAVLIDLATGFFIGWLGIARASIDKMKSTAPASPYDVFLTVPGSVPEELLQRAEMLRVQWPDGSSKTFDPKSQRRNRWWPFGKGRKAA